MIEFDCSNDKGVFTNKEVRFSSEQTDERRRYKRASDTGSARLVGVLNNRISEKRHADDR